VLQDGQWGRGSRFGVGPLGFDSSDQGDDDRLRKRLRPLKFAEPKPMPVVSYTDSEHKNYKYSCRSSIVSTTPNSGTSLTR
jgi:hypothetical protein